MTDITIHHPGISYAHAAAEIGRELEQRRRVYPDRVAKLRMTQAEADYQIAIFTAIAADVAAMTVPMRHYVPATHSFSWDERMKALQRELDYRRRFYPEWIAKMRLSQAKADHQIACIAAILRRYREGFGWTPANGTPSIPWADAGKRPRTAAECATDEERAALWRYPTGRFFTDWYPELLPAGTAPAQAAML